MVRTNVFVRLLLIAVLLSLLLTLAFRMVLPRSAFIHRLSRHWPSKVESFNSRDWQNPALARKEPFVRNRMVNDLLKRYVLAGMSRKKIQSLLGNPDYADRDSVSYILRPDGPDAKILELQYDANDTLRSAIVTTN